MKTHKVFFLRLRKRVVKSSISSGILISFEKVSEIKNDWKYSKVQYKQHKQLITEDIDFMEGMILLEGSNKERLTLTSTDFPLVLTESRLLNK